MSPAPPTTPTVSPRDRAATLVTALSNEELVGQVLMPSIGLSAPAEQSAKLIADYRLGGVILMGDVENTTAGGTAAQVRALTDALRAARPSIGGAAAEQVELLLGTDQEYGWVTRIKSGLVQLPSAMTFGAAGRPELTEAAWNGAGKELSAVGINVDFAPGRRRDRPAWQLRDRIPLVRRRRGSGRSAGRCGGQRTAVRRGGSRHEALSGPWQHHREQPRRAAGPDPEPGCSRRNRPGAVPGRHHGRRRHGHVRAPGRSGDRPRAAGELLQQGAGRPPPR